jgi:hypothetical protein
MQDANAPTKVKDVFDEAKVYLSRIQTRLSDWDKMVEKLDFEHEKEEDTLIASECSCVNSSFPSSSNAPLFPFC